MKFTEDHEWLRKDGDLVVVGITEHASTQLGDVVFVELPEPETKVAKGDEICVIESVKAASDIVAPVDGEIVEVNDDLADNPGLVNEDPLGGAWFFTRKSPPRWAKTTRSGMMWRAPWQGLTELDQHGTVTLTVMTCPRLLWPLRFSIMTGLSGSSLLVNPKRIFAAFLILRGRT